MIEDTVLNYLTEKMIVPVVMEIPEGRKFFVVIEKTGSSIENFITRSTFAIQSYAPSLYEAAKLNDDVKKAMEGIEALDEISKCSLNSDYNFTDTRTKSNRYQAVFDLVHY